MDPIQVLEDQYFSLRDTLDSFEDAGATPDQIEVLQGLISTSRGNYFKAVKNALTQHNAEVDALTSQLSAEQQTLDATVEHIENVSKVLDFITQAVAFGSKLAAKIVSL